MADFLKAFPLVMRIEGGTANDPDDTGGFTYKGISFNNYPNWAGWKLVFKLNPGKKTGAEIDRALDALPELQKLVLAFYKTEFWDINALDYISDFKIATELFDTGVNMGTGVSSVFLQNALNITNNNGKLYPDLKVDGKIGPVTIGYMNKHPRPADVLKTLNIMQGARYIEICKRNPKKEKFYRSWLSRVSLN